MLTIRHGEMEMDGNGDFESGGFVAAFMAGGYELGPRQNVAAVPEPGHCRAWSPSCSCAGLASRTKKCFE